MFDICKHDEQASVACALVQKIANKTRTIPEGFSEKNVFKAMLKQIQKSVPNIQTKSLVDTYYSLGKLKEHLP